MRHRTWDHQQKPWLHQNSNSHSIMYDPGGISNDSTFSGATQASSNSITSHSDTPSTHPLLPFDNDNANHIHICSYTGNATRLNTGWEM